MKRILFFLIVLVVGLLLGCKKDSGISYPFYFTATINNKSVNYDANDLNTQYGCGISFPSNGVGQDIDQYVGTLIEDELNPTTNAIYVHQLKRFNHSPSEDEMRAMWSIGSFNYGKSNLSIAGGQTINGASITYYDEQGEVWTSEGGVQAGSSFTVTELTDNPNKTSAKIFTAKFNCTLYDDNGHSVKLENGVIRGKLFVP